ncbi:FG-GAP-like repeat-containing protein [Thalassoglobus sp. JC818]|uniref:FG-GAP-like repeat-containing protein n=1 Tax=Thalassoglobus sp. JC818 TaxID=3232136 RepID=UPI00345A86DF
MKSLWVWIGIVIAIVLVVAALIRKEKQVQNDQPDNVNESYDDDVVVSTDFFGTRYVGIALLENKDWQESDRVFAELAEVLPNEILPWRNLAIARTGAVEERGQRENKEEANHTITRESAVEAIQSLREKEPDEPYSYRMEARLIDPVKGINEKIRLLNEASKRSPEDPTIWYEIYSVGRVAPSEDARNQSNAAILKAYEFAPENLFVILSVLAVQLETQDPAIRETLQAARPLFEPFQKRIQEKTRADVMKFLDAAIAGVESMNWNQVRANLIPFSNITKPEDAVQSDRRRIESNLLEFIKVDFSEGLEEIVAVFADQAATNLDITFEEQTLISGIEGSINDLQLVDFDLDTSLELVILQPSKLSVWRKEVDDSEQTENWAEVVSLSFEGEFEHVLVADLDNDADGLAVGDLPEGSMQYTADLDLVLYGIDGIKVVRTNLEEVGGVISLELVDQAGSLAELAIVSCVRAGDLNADGDLDLALITDGKLEYWNNNGNFEFQKMPLTTEMPEGTVADVLIVDFDRDIDQDIVVLMEDGTVGVLEGLRHGDFRWLELDSLDEISPARSLAINDANRNGAWELLCLGEDGVSEIQTRIPTTGELQVIATNEISHRGSPVLIEWDYNNDGLRDILTIESRQLRFRHGGEGGAYVESEELITGDEKFGKLIRCGDLDGDGDDDLVTLRGQEIIWLKNEGGNRNHWLDVAVIAQLNKGDGQSQRINHFGIGCTIEVRAGAFVQLLPVLDPGPRRFGLNEIEQADAVRVVWTNGIPENIIQPATDQLVWERQTLTGSCPYLYAWNGERFEFVTDLLWAAPIGLTNAQGEIVPDRPWEYLKISGDQLKARDGRYQLQVTEELWEAAYFDQVELFAIDHPADIEIVTNEKVGPPSIAEHHIYGIAERKTPVSAHNHSGRDLLPEIQNRDAVYAKPFDKKRMQGFTDESFVELDLGLEEPPQNLTLYLTGWMYPTDTGLNRAIFENRQLDGPVPPAISVPGPDGEFVQVVDYCGFPGGKTKTIAIPLGNPFLTDDFRLRISTSMELYWDEISFTTETVEFPSETTPLNLSSADLHYRGVSQMTPGDNFGPEQFDYEQVDPSPAWQSMGGMMTRYGDVRELLLSTDAQMVVMGSGDEMTLSFDVPDKGIPEGWTRDFIIRSVGWDKDANLHTVYGQSSEPLPFVGMKSYPPDPNVTLPHDEEYLRKYQTRRMDPDGFRTALRRLKIDRIPENSPSVP